MSKNTSIALGEHFTSFIDERVSAGRYGSASEMVRAGLRILEVEERKLEILQAAIDKGLESGIVENFDMAEFQREMDKESGNE